MQLSTSSSIVAVLSPCFCAKALNPLPPYPRHFLCLHCDDARREVIGMCASVCVYVHVSTQVCL